MRETLKYSYHSVYSQYIEGFILQKKECGFVYDAESYVLKKFDEFCSLRGYSDVPITREIAMEWAVQRSKESVNYRNRRVSVFRQLSIYMNSMGIDSYIPRHQASRTIAAPPHIPTAGELRELFDVIDRYLPEQKQWQVYAMEYPVLFRLYYCCGLRLAEGCYLRCRNVNLSEGILTILGSKGRKDRLVYMASDLTALCKRYDSCISAYYPNREWFFPGRGDGKPFAKTSIDSKFRYFWEMTECSKRCEKRPTVHALRHAFVVDRMNKWMLEGVSLETMAPYLSRYLGHSGLSDTMYYYHHVREAFQVLRQKDRMSMKIIPEVVEYEG
jgi:integrase